MHNESRRVLLSHGDGGLLTRELIENVFITRFDSEQLKLQADAALLPESPGRIAFTTDAFTIDPLFFPGGDIGKLAVCGTVNDLAVSGARPGYIAAAFIIEEGLDMGVLEKVVISMAKECRSAGVEIVAGDTKVVERGHIDRIFITTTGLGRLPEGVDLGYHRISPGDLVLVSGSIGEHGMAVMAARYNLDTGRRLASDCACLNGLIEGLLKKCPGVKLMRDLTRGGLATAVKEIALSSKVDIWLEESAIPVSSAVRKAAGVLGLDPLYLANEGKFLAVTDPREAGRALEFLRSVPLGRDAAIVGEVRPGDGNAYLKTLIGGTRFLELLAGSPLPRIC